MIRLSLPIKVLLLGGITYLLAFFAVQELGRRYPFDFFLLPAFCAVLAVAIATYFLFDRPLNKLMQTMTKAAEGDFLIRASAAGSNEVGRLAHNFNEMLKALTDLSARKIQSDHDLIIAQEELKYKKKLEEKNKLIARANRQLENLVRDLGLLYEVGQMINQTIELDQLYTLITEVLKKHLKLENFSLMVWDEKKQCLQIRSAFGFSNMGPLKEMTFQAGEGIAGEVLKRGEAIYVKDAGEESRFAKKAIEIHGSVLAVPLSYKGTTIGVANFGRDRSNAFGTHDIKMLTLAANQIALAIANARLYTQTRELSVTDELTGVFNRRHFSQVLQLEWKRANRFKRDLSLLMVDVDYFKHYNDTYGHLKGDEVLRKLGSLLDENLRDVDTIARFGGEEFVVLLPDTDKRGALAVAEKLRHLVQEKVAGITVSVGVANYPEDVQEIDDLIDHADIALYDAKDQGRNKVTMYHPTPDREIPGREEPLKPMEGENREKGAKSRLVH